MSAFSIAIQAYDLAEERYNEYAKYFHGKYDQYRGPNGLTREDIRLSAEFREDSRKLNRLMQHQGKIVKFLLKNFKKEFRDLSIQRRDAKRAERLAKNSDNE